MGKFTKIPQDTFDTLQLDAGILLFDFDPETGEFDDEDIITATTGGINPTCIPTFSDFAEDVDNAPANVKEMKHLDSWECKMAFTALGTSPELIRLSLGCADINSNVITPRRDLEQSDFADIWWVGDKADGGMVAIQLLNALSTGGFSLQTTKNGKGQVACELTGHVSIDEQDVVPMVFYSTQGGEAVTPDVTLNRANLSVTVGATKTLTARTSPTGEAVAWSSSSTSVATVSNGAVTGVSAGTANITATMTYGGSTYTDTCKVTVTAAG